MSLAPFGAVPFGNLALPADQAGYDIDIPVSIELLSVDIDIPVSIELPSNDIYIGTRITAVVDREFNIPVRIDLPSTDINIPVNLRLAPSVDINIPTRIQTPMTTGFPLISQKNTWSVFIDGVDYSARLTGSRMTDQAIDESGIAEFSLRLDSGPVDDMSWLRKRVKIDIAVNGDGVTRYTGEVDDAHYDDAKGIIRFTCTTKLQGWFENASRSSIDGVVGGKYSEHFFNDDSDGWSYAQDRLSTQFACLVQNRNGQPRVVSRQPKVVPDFTFTESEVIKGSISNTKRSNRNELINRIRATISYRYQRLRQRHIHVNFQHTMVSGNAKRLDICDYLINPYDVCERSEIESAIANNDWKQYGDISYEELPPDGVYDCQGYATTGSSQRVVKVWTMPGDTRESSCFAARFMLARRWSQSVTENYVYDFQAPNSIKYSGEVGMEMSFAVDNDYDPGEWNSNEEYDGPEDGAVVDESGDYVIDANTEGNTREVFNQAVETLQAYAVNEIHRSHQANERDFSVPFHAGVKPGDTVRLNVSTLSGSVDVTGLVKRVRDESKGLGGTRTTITLLFSGHGGTGSVSDTALEPADLPEFTDLPDVDNTFLLGYHMGAESTSQPEQEHWQGFFTNRKYNLNFPFIQYKKRFKLIVPGIDAAYQSAVEATRVKTIDVDVQADPLTVTVG